MKKTSHGTALALSMLLAAATAPALAQDTADGRTDRVDTVETRDDDGFPWGLLGLLGLLGLMPRKQHTTVHHDTHRTGTTTGTHR